MSTRPTLRLDAAFLNDPLLVRAMRAPGGGADAVVLWVAGIAYAHAQDTAGHLPEFVLPALAPGLGLSTMRLAQVAEALVASDLWEHEEPSEEGLPGYRVTHYARWRGDTPEVLARRESDRVRQARHRARLRAAARTSTDQADHAEAEAEAEQQVLLPA